MKRAFVVGAGTALTAVFLSFSQGGFAQEGASQPSAALPANDTVQVDDPPKDIPKKEPRPLNAIEKRSRKSFKGRDPKRPYHAYYVAEAGSDEPLIAENEQAVVHIASISKVITAMAFYHCRDLALAEAETDSTYQAVQKQFADKEPYLAMALVYSNNKRANEVAHFLEHLDLDFIEQAKEEKKIKPGNMRVFSQIIVPQLLDEIGGIENTVVHSASGLPPDNYRQRRWRSEIAPEDRPDNYKGNGANYRAYYSEDYNRSTPVELARIVSYGMEHFPQIWAFSSMHAVEDTISSQQKTYYGFHYNTNHLLENGGEYRGEPIKGVNGLKTGTTTTAGKSQVTTVDRDGIKLVVVDMGHSSSSVRDAHMVDMIREAYQILEPKRLEKLRLDSIALAESSQRQQDSLLLVQEQRAQQRQQDSLELVTQLREEIREELIEELREWRQNITLDEIDDILQTMLEQTEQQDSLSNSFMSAKNQRRLARLIEKYKKIVKDSIDVKEAPERGTLFKEEQEPVWEN